MNLYMCFLDYLRFECNFCYFVIEVSYEYMCNLGVNGKCMDWME